MKAKTVSSSKKKAASSAKKKIATAAKKKTVSSSKKAVAATVKKKPVSPIQKKPVTIDHVMEYVKDTFKGMRIAYFALDTEQTKDGAFNVCVAVEGEAGFYKLDLGLHCSYVKAKAEAVRMNTKLGLNEEQVNKIIISTMGQSGHH